MSFHVFIGALDDLETELRLLREGNQYGLRSDEIGGIETRLNELLEDLTDYSRSRDNEHLTIKLANLAPSDEKFGYPRTTESELESRILRIQRALRTFGAKEIAEEEAFTESRPTQLEASKSSKEIDSYNDNVFVVHGHNDAVLHQVVRVLSDLELNPIVLREKPNRGATIIEKFEVNSDVGFAVVLMTADDMGASIEDAENSKHKPRARQNVVLELGYFIGALTRSRVCVLKSPHVEEPSDIFGVVYTQIDGAGAWKLTLGQELKAAGYNIDLNNL